MKVKLEDNYRDIYTVAEYEQAKRVIEASKEDTMPAKEYAIMAVREVLRANCEFANWEILKVTAETCKNLSIAWDGFCEGSGLFDVLLSITVKLSFTQFAEIYAKMSDIWQIDGESNIAGLFDVWRYNLVRE